ncbi:MAG: OmpH family outer membrane protein [Alphaproteobacteria bacterium]
MRTIKTMIIAAGAIALSGLAVPALAEAPAQGAIPQTYAFVDMSQVMHKATAAKAVIDELNSKSEQIIADINKKQQSIVGERDALTKQRGTLSKEEFMPKAKALEEKYDALLKSREDRKNQFGVVERKALSDVRKAVGDVIEAVAQEHKFAAVFSRDAVIIGAKDLDITDEVITRMNASGKKVAVDWSATKAPKK